MLLAIDVGNTITAIGVYRERTLVGNWRISTSKERTSDEIGMILLSLLGHAGISPGMISDVIMCTVAPPVMHAMSNAKKIPG